MSILTYYRSPGEDEDIQAWNDNGRIDAETIDFIISVHHCSEEEAKKISNFLVNTPKWMGWPKVADLPNAAVIIQDAIETMRLIDMVRGKVRTVFNLTSEDPLRYSFPSCPEFTFPHGVSNGQLIPLSRPKPRSQPEGPAQ